MKDHEIPQRLANMWEVCRGAFESGDFAKGEDLGGSKRQAADTFFLRQKESE